LLSSKKIPAEYKAFSAMEDDGRNAMNNVGMGEFN
jgi:hypothetical protein